MKIYQFSNVHGHLKYGFSYIKNDGTIKYFYVTEGKAENAEGWDEEKWDKCRGKSGMLSAFKLELIW